MSDTEFQNIEHVQWLRGEIGYLKNRAKTILRNWTMAHGQVLVSGHDGEELQRVNESFAFRTQELKDELDKPLP